MIFKIAFLFFIWSLPVFSGTSDYFFVLKKPLSDQLSSMGISVQNDFYTQGQLLPSDIVNGLGIDGLSNLSLYKIHNVPVSFTNLNGTTVPKTVDHDTEYFYKVSINDENLDSFLTKIRQLDSFVHVQPNYRYTKYATKADAESEPSYSLQETGMELMNFPAVWDIASGNGIVVAVLDTGLKINHEEFCPAANDPDASDSDAVVDTSIAYLNGCTKIVSPQDMIASANFSAANKIYPIPGEDYIDRDYYPDDDIDGHGTHVAGIVGASVNDNGISGAAFGVSIMPVKVLYPFQNLYGQKSATGETSDIAAGIDYAVANNADVINMSLGSDGSLGVENDYIMLTAVQGALSQGVIIIAAAGNSRLDIDDAGSIPASFAEVMAVSASDNTGGFVTTYSNYGSVDVAAFGGGYNSNGNCVTSTGVYSSYNQNTTDYQTLCGTSMSAPYVSALAAIIKGYYKDTQSKTLTPAEIRRLINISANRSKAGTTTQYGNGVIDAKNALFMAGVNSFNNETSSEFAMGSSGLFSDLLCYPNPLDISNQSNTTCSYYLNQSASVSYVIVSRRGQILVKSNQSNLTNGKHSFQWDARDMSSNKVPKGVYQLIFTATPISSGYDKWTSKHLITVL